MHVIKNSAINGNKIKDFDLEELFIKRFISKGAKGNKNALYVHTPFCLNKCSYCPYQSTEKYVKKDMDTFYNQTLPQQIETYKDVFSSIMFDEIYFGGGTPTIVSADQLSKVFDLIPNFDKIPMKSIEVSPNTLTHDHVKLFKERKFGFISIGIQSLNKMICKKHNRVHLSNTEFLELSKTMQQSKLYFNYDFICFLNKGDIRDLVQFEEEIEYVMNYGKPACITIHQYNQSVFSTEKTRYLTNILNNILERNPNYVCVNSMLDDTEIEDDTIYEAEYKLVSRDYDLNLSHYMYNKYPVSPIEGYNILSLGYYKEHSTFSNVGSVCYRASENHLFHLPINPFLEIVIPKLEKKKVLDRDEYYEIFKYAS